MLTLAIVLASVLYTAAALQTTRHVAGQWHYKTWQRDRARYRSITAERYENYHGSDDGFLVFGAFCLCATVLPIMLFYTAAASRGRFMLEPKQFREEQRMRELEHANKVHKETIARMERENGIGVS